MSNIISGIRTFFKSPIISSSLYMDDGYIRKYGIVGVPYDAGCTFNRGAAFGPAAIRDASTMLCDGGDAETQADVMSHTIDLGDVDFSFDINDYSKNSLRIFNQHLITVGGDHSIALMTIQRMFETYGPIQLIHFDAHNDAWDGPSNHGTFIRQALDAGWIDNLTQIGVRSPSPKHVQDYLNNNPKVKNIACDHIGEKTPYAYNHIFSLKDMPTYITFDIDVLEPSSIGFGTGTPEPFGLSPREMLHIFRAVVYRHKNVLKGMDIVEVSPSLDANNMAACMAANIIWKYIAYMER